MARTVAALPAGSRITDYISLGVIAKFFPAVTVVVLPRTGHWKSGRKKRWRRC